MSKCVVCGDPASLTNKFPRCTKHRKWIYKFDCQACGKAGYTSNHGVVGHRQDDPNCIYKDQPIEPDHPRLIRLERENRELLDIVDIVNKKLKASHRTENMFESLAAIIRNEVSPLPVAEFDFKAHAPRKDSTQVDAVALLSDEHGDQVITAAGTWGLESYDYDIFRCRLQRWAQTIIDHCTVHLPRHRFERLWILKLGDAIHGDIHGNKDRNHFGNSIKAALAVGDAEAQAIQLLRPHFPGGVNVVSVPGNHPRTTIRIEYDDPHSNFDYLVTTQIATRLINEIKAGNVTVFTPRSWSAFVDIRGHLWALNHGHGVKGFAGFPWYGFSRRNNRVQAMVAHKGARVKYFVYGHYHSSVSFPDGIGKSKHSGNWSFTDPYAAESLAVGSEPEQQLYAVDDKRGIILEIPIFVRDEDAEQKFRQGKWTPSFGQDLILDTVSAQREGFQVIRAKGLIK